MPFSSFSPFVITVFYPQRLRALSIQRLMRERMLEGKTVWTASWTVCLSEKERAKASAQRKESISFERAKQWKAAPPSFDFPNSTLYVYVSVSVSTRWHEHMFCSLCVHSALCLRSFSFAYLVVIPWKVSSFVLWKWKLRSVCDKLSCALSVFALQPKFPMICNVLWRRVKRECKAWTSTFSTLMLQLLMLRAFALSLALSFWLSFNLGALSLSASIFQ